MAVPIWCGGMKMSPASFDLSGRAQRFGIGDDEAEAVAVHGEASGDEVLVGGGLRECVAVGVDCDECAAFHQLLQMVGRVRGARRRAGPSSRTSCLYPAWRLGWRAMCLRMACRRAWSFELRALSYRALSCQLSAFSITQAAFGVRLSRWAQT